MIPSSPRFVEPRHREAAAVLCGTVTASFGRDDVEDVATRLLEGIEGDDVANELSAVEVACGASYLLTKLVADTETVFGVPSKTTLARLGLWIATDECAGEA